MVRTIVRTKYDAEWGARADGQIAATLGKEALAELMYRGHPYGRLTLGHASELKSMSLPANCCILAAAPGSPASSLG